MARPAFTPRATLVRTLRMPIDDNYWAGPKSPRPRRMFTDLPVGMPEAQAAFQNGYNTKPRTLTPRIGTRV